jgi:hypothetical protein
MAYAADPRRVASSSESVRLWILYSLCCGLSGHIENRSYRNWEIVSSLSDVFGETALPSELTPRVWKFSHKSDWPLR